MGDVTNHGGNVSELQSWRQRKLQLWRQEIGGNVSCNYDGKQKKRRADIATNDEVKRQRQDMAGGPVSMSEIRRIQDALYR